MGMHVHHVCTWYLGKPEGGSGSTGTEVTGVPGSPLSSSSRAVTSHNR